MVHLGIDTGGTFTDFVALDDHTGRVVTLKVPSVPEDPARAVLEGLGRLAVEAGIAGAAVGRVLFGTTVATNAVLERKGARTALLTTRGTRDVLELQRLWRPRLFDLYLQKPPPLVPRRWRFEVTERVGADGAVVVPLEDAEAVAAARRVAGAGVEAVAVCLLFAFLRPEHEHRLRAALRAHAPGIHVSLSSEVAPQFREYERTVTTVLNAYVMPKIHHLAERLEAVRAQAGVAGEIRILQSNGGLMSLDTARTRPVHTLLSGPAGGVVGALAVAQAAGLRDLITMDMGGTSLDIGLVREGRIALISEGHVGGFPVQVPQVDVHTIGAGGGSLARVVRGALRVGPESAGADPGPACYGRGGVEPTSTDAAVALGLIDPDYFLGGRIRLDPEAARRALADRVGAPLGLGVEAAAWAVVRVQVAGMVTGIRAVSVERGLDPRDFSLLPFGGAGGLYAGLVAEELGIRRLLVPLHASVLSALGMLMTDVRLTEATTRLLAAEETDPATLAALYAPLEARLRARLAAEGLGPDRVCLERSCDMRYRGQAYEINVPVAAGPMDAEALAALVARFHAQHQALFGQSAPGEPVELVTFRVTGTGEVTKARLLPLPPGPGGEPVVKASRRVWLGEGRAREVPVYERAALLPGHVLTGPAVVEEPGATVVLYPGHRAVVDAYGNLDVTLGPGR